MNTQRTYLDFELRIEDLGGGRYRATVVDMPLGEGPSQVAHEFSLPFGAGELDRILAVLSGRASATADERLRTARAFGEALFETVFAGPVYTVYFSSRDRARTANGLRIKLALDDAGDLARLPWEFLRDPAIDYLALSRSTPLVRHPRRLVIRPRPVFTPPLRVLVMIASPNGLPPIDAEAEWRVLLAATEQLRAAGRLELERIEDASLRTLQRTLRARAFHVFHYIGHSAFDPATGQGTLALEDAMGEGSRVLVRAEDLARELSEENTIRLVVLNSCQSAVQPQHDPFAGIASSIVARGVPAVVAMQYTIAEDAARVFSEELYRAVAEGSPIDAAVAEARRAISHTAGGIAWATPVLFMRAADGRLFEFGETIAARRGLPRALLAGVAGAILLAVILLGAYWLLREDAPPPATPPAATDLVIEQIEIFPKRPNPGEKAAVIVHIANAGPTAVGPFEYAFLEDVLDDAPSIRGQVDPLAAGEATTVFIPHSFSWWGAFVAEVRIDVAGAVQETDKFNNIRRSPVVTGDGPLTFTFEEMPDGEVIDETRLIGADAFAAWGVRLDALPPDAYPACADVALWIVVEDGGRYLGTGLPDDPAVCTDGTIQVTIEHEAVSGVSATYEGAAEGTYALAVFDRDGETLDEATAAGRAETATLAIEASFPARLAIRRVAFSTGGAPARITALALDQPAGVVR